MSSSVVSPSLSAPVVAKAPRIFHPHPPPQQIVLTSHHQCNHHPNHHTTTTSTTNSTTPTSISSRAGCGSLRLLEVLPATRSLKKKRLQSRRISASNAVLRVTERSSRPTRVSISTSFEAAPVGREESQQPPPEPRKQQPQKNPQQRLRKKEQPHSSIQTQQQQQQQPQPQPHAAKTALNQHLHHHPLSSRGGSSREGRQVDLPEAFRYERLSATEQQQFLQDLLRELGQNMPAEGSKSFTAQIAALALYLNDLTRELTCSSRSTNRLDNSAAKTTTNTTAISTTTTRTTTTKFEPESLLTHLNRSALKGNLPSNGPSSRSSRSSGRSENRQLFFEAAATESSSGGKAKSLSTLEHAMEWQRIRFTSSLRTDRSTPSSIDLDRFQSAIADEAVLDLAVCQKLGVLGVDSDSDDGDEFTSLLAAEVLLGQSKKKGGHGGLSKVVPPPATSCCSSSETTSGETLADFSSSSSCCGEEDETTDYFYDNRHDGDSASSCCYDFSHLALPPQDFIDGKRWQELDLADLPPSALPRRSRRDAARAEQPLEKAW